MRPIDPEENSKLGSKAKRFGPGYVYLIRQKGTNTCKIGISINPDYRLTQIDHAVPFDVELVHQILVPSMRRSEDLWHNLFRRWRLKGEWFALTDAAIRLFCSCNGRNEHGIEYEIFVVNSWYLEHNHGA